MADTFAASKVLPWSGDWLWSLPLIVFTVVMHAAGLSFIRDRLANISRDHPSAPQHPAVLALTLGGTILVMTVLHAFEACIWAFAYVLLGAFASFPEAILYSLSAMTTYGHASLYLNPHWQMMGALEALNGALLFGLTTAVLFAIIDRLWHERHDPRSRQN